MRLNKLGRYDLIRVLGKGAMGLVYEARDPNLDRRVAIKTIRVENLSDEAAAEYEVRFRTEARSAARLQHPNIVSVYDSDRDLDIAYLVMEFIEGDDLKYHLDRGDVYTLEQTLGIMRDLLSALDYAHQQSIVHRDIKPANLLIEASGRVKLADFGVARIQNSGEATRTQGTMVGTLKYMSPEQIQGHPVDARADLFAAGIVLYQLLTGKRAFDAETDFALIQQITSHEPAAPSYLNPQLPLALDAVMARALAKSRNQRYATAQAFSAALQDASRQAADPTVVPPSSLKDKRAASTWTATLRAGESLLSTQPGSSLMTNTATPINMGTNTNGSIVTQELELVYWKDIKDSVDVEDIEVFLAKFPAGIYADLARRRLKKLAQPLGEVSGIGLVTSTLLTQPLPEQDGLDKTIMVPRHAAEMAAPADIVRAPASASPPAESTTQESLKAASQTIEAEDVPPNPPEARTVSTTPADVLPETTAITDKTDRPVQPIKTPVAPPRPAVTATETNTEISPPNAPQAPTLSPLPTQRLSEKQIPPAPIAATSPSRRLVWAIAGVVALACAAVGVKLFSSSPAADASLAIAGAASAPVVAASAPDLAASALPGVALPTNVVAASSASSANAANAAVAAASAAPAPASSASAAAASKAALAQAAAKKAAIEKNRLARLALEKNTAQSSPADNAVAPPPLPSPEKTVTSAAAQAAVANSPRQACEDRVLIGFQICMRDQCARPVFANHPICVERKAMEQQRRDAQMGK